MNTYFTSDHHFGHKNVIKYCGRPYKSVEEMNEDLVSRWNEIVQADDWVYYLGDFSMSKKALTYVKLLNGHKALIPGNHDTCFPGHKNWLKQEQFYRDAGFEHIFVTPQERCISGIDMMMWHLPYVPDLRPDGYDVRYEQWRIKDDGRWLLHGHVHERLVEEGSHD